MGVGVGRPTVDEFNAELLGESMETQVVRSEAQSVYESNPPRLRGISHLLGFLLAVPVGLIVVIRQPGGVAEIAACAFALSVTAMFGTSSLFHRRRWDPVGKSRMAVADHAMIYALIAGTYTPFALLVLHPGWRFPVLATAWGAALVATGIKVVHRDAPAWVAAATCVFLGWMAAFIVPQIVGSIGVGGSALLLAGGLAYTCGALVYARKSPDPLPTVFGYHEIFHALVVIGVACQYATIAFFVLPRA
jgi:hemolysin III